MDKALDAPMLDALSRSLAIGANFPGFLKMLHESLKTDPLTPLAQNILEAAARGAEQGHKDALHDNPS